MKAQGKVPSIRSSIWSSTTERASRLGSSWRFDLLVRKGLYILWILSSAFVAAIVLCSCSFSADYRDAVNATNIFHRLMDGGEYAAIYDAASQGLQPSLSRDTFIGFLTRVNRKMGKCGEATVALGGYEGGTSGTFVKITSSRVCANGTLGEQFVWRMVEGKATLFHYHAENPLLLTD
jgi:hypothetical protein